MNETAALITALGTLITASAALASVIFNSKRIKTVDHKVEVVDGKIDEVHEEVKTGNSQTLAQLADAVETRRIDEIPVKDRTTLEKSHVRDIGGE